MSQKPGSTNPPLHNLMQKRSMQPHPAGADTRETTPLSSQSLGAQAARLHLSSQTGLQSATPNPLTSYGAHPAAHLLARGLQRPGGHHRNSRMGPVQPGSLGSQLGGGCGCSRQCRAPSLPWPSLDAPHRPRCWQVACRARRAACSSVSVLGVQAEAGAGPDRAWKGARAVGALCPTTACSRRMWCWGQAPLPARGCRLGRGQAGLRAHT